MEFLIILGWILAYFLIGIVFMVIMCWIYDDVDKSLQDDPSLGVIVAFWPMVMLVLLAELMSDHFGSIFGHLVRTILKKLPKRRK